MKSNYAKVYQFHKEFQLTLNDNPNNDSLRDQSLVSLRLSLINEELKEFHTASDQSNVIEMIDAIGDILYVVYGTCVSFGILQEFEYSFDHTKYVDFSVHEHGHVHEHGPVHVYIYQMEDYVKKLGLCITEQNMCSVKKILGSMLYITYDFGYKTLDINVDQIFDIIHSSNMSKLCSSEKEALDSISWYQLTLADRYDSPRYKKSSSGNYWIIYNESNGKVLKNINYTKPVFGHIQ